jgi:mannose-6-phosphate isomerase-like protein (cupin superfamily)
MLDRVRRIVTGHDRQGQSVVHFDGILPRRLGSNRRGVTDLWSTDGGPVDSQMAEDRLALPFSLVPAPHGTTFLFFTVAPEEPQADAESEARRAAAAFAAYGAEQARPDTCRNPWMHKTKTIDYIILLSGEVTLLLDGDERELKPFDVVIQRGTNHAWINRGKEPALFAAILMDADVR